jgi:DNA replication protein DnaC
VSYSQQVFEAAVQQLEKRRVTAETEAQNLRMEMTRRHPRLKEIDLALASTGNKLAKAILQGGDIDAAVLHIQEENLALQKEMADILKKEGCPVANFDPVYTCQKCGDTGYAEGKRCGCFTALLKELSAKEVCKGMPVTPCEFDGLDLSFYDDTVEAGKSVSEKERMRRVFAYCKQYAENFDLSAPSLLLRGATGTGKTHISLAIAATAASNGFSVIYQPAGKLFHTLEKEHFGKQNGDTLSLILECDLLVLDDLGTEFETAFCTATLYNILNTRMLDGLPTIISTNLTQEGLCERYGDQIVSRITGAFEPILFVGKDIRQQKRTRAMLENR